MPVLSAKSQNNKLLYLVLALALLMLATANLWGVIETSEARYAEVGREMLRSGDWLHPKLMGIYHYHKPPLTYWLTAASYSVFGVNPFAARFFLTVAFCIQVLVVYRIAMRLFKNEQTAYYAALVYATLPIVLISVRGLTTDAYLVTFILLAVYWWIQFRETGRAMFLYAMAAAVGLGFLTKGPVVLVLPIFAVLGLRRWYPPAPVGALRIAFALLIFLLISFSWFVFLTAENPLFADYFFFRHLVDRVAHAEVFSRAKPWYYYLPMIPVIYLPWIGMVLPGGREESAPRPEGRRLTRRLAVWWFLGPLILFSMFTSKLVLYILPLSIGFSLVAAYFLTFGRFRPLYWVFFPIIGIIYIALIAAPFFPPGFHYNAILISLPALALLASAGMLLLKMKKEPVVTAWSFLFAATLIVYASLFFRMNSVQVNGVTPIASFIKENGLQDREILVYNELLPSLSFELDKDIVSVYAGSNALKRETQFQKDEEWENYWVDETVEEGRLKVRRALSERSVLIVKNKLPEEVQTMMAGSWNEKKFGKWVVYYN